MSLSSNGEDPREYDYVVVGGGICGVSCAETISVLDPASRCLLISGSPLVKVATGVRQLTKTLEEFDVEEKSFDFVESRNANLSVVFGEVGSISSSEHIVQLTGGSAYHYKFACICTGGRPKVVAPNNPYVLGIRDTESVEEFMKKLSSAKRIVILGNGGIATEIIWELRGVEAIWVIKDSSISAAFMDAGAAEFFTDAWHRKRAKIRLDSLENPSKRLKYTSIVSSKNTTYGSALGPDWSANLPMHGSCDAEFPLQIEYNCEVKRFLSPDEYLTNIGDIPLSQEKDWPVYVELTNGRSFGCDFIVSATGVVSNVDFLRSSMSCDAFAFDGGVIVNDQMESGIPDVFVAGDACTAGWKPSEHWFQMRLWTQARQMGAYAAKCMIAKRRGENISLDFAFELFAHATNFFGFKVVLLGVFNGQRLENNYEILLRMTKGVEFIKLVLRNGKIQGAVLIGETDLEETFENLILNGTDVSSYGEQLLNPDIDIEGYFD